jgi:hypothetical protein
MAQSCRNRTCANTTLRLPQRVMSRSRSITPFGDGAKSPQRRTLTAGRNEKMASNQDRVSGRPMASFGF